MLKKLKRYVNLAWSNFSTMKKFVVLITSTKAIVLIYWNMLWIDMSFKFEIKFVFVVIVDFSCRFCRFEFDNFEIIQRSDFVSRFNSENLTRFKSVLTAVFDDSNLCINVQKFDVRLKRKLNDSLINFSMKWIFVGYFEFQMNCEN